MAPDQDSPHETADYGPELAVEWSRLAYEIAYAEDQFQTFKGQRALAMMHLAIHDALQAIVPVYAAFGQESSEPSADPIAAAARAAHDVVVAAYPDRSTDVHALLDRWLSRTQASDAAIILGTTLGRASAQAIIAARQNDGWDEPGSYEFRNGPGQYRTTPPWDGVALQPGFRHTRPFTFDDPARFLPPPPPALDSPEYAEALNEVRLQGDSTSTVRTADETGYAVWWMEFSESAAGRVARRMLLESDLDLWGANRVLAKLYIALLDGYIVVWESKYEYNHWRPYTSIRAAATDGNPATAADADWVPLRTTPPFPEYVSAHATGCA
ncbi:MAG: vanadium-dependent haloperoxidase, partial [Longimicrobiales bacterium]